MTAFTLGAMIAAIPGALYAHYISYIDPTSFTVDESIFILSIVIIGGMRNLRGSVVAAAFSTELASRRDAYMGTFKIIFPPTCAKSFTAAYWFS